MRISRPCYDKMHRCPGWVGGGCLSARHKRCAGGSLDGARDGSLYEGFWWRWRFNRHGACGVVVLPYVVRWIDWRWLTYWLPVTIRDMKYDREWRRSMRAEHKREARKLRRS